MTEQTVQPALERPAKLPPRWFIRLAWISHKAIYRLTGGRRGLGHPMAGGSFGYLRLKTVGRRSGRERAVILGYVEDGRNLVTLAMNGWSSPEPAWWLNLRARPEATVELKGGASFPVRARPAEGEERRRLWDRVQEFRGWGHDIDAFARLRSMPTTVVVFEPRS